MKLKPALRSNQISTNAQTYQEVLKITIAKPQRLCMIEVLSDNDAKTKWKIETNPSTYEEFMGTTPKKFPYPVETQLEPGDEITISGRSTDGTSVTLDAHATLLVEEQ